MNRKYKVQTPVEEQSSELSYQGPRRVPPLESTIADNSQSFADNDARRLAILRGAVRNLWVDMQSLGLNTPGDLSKGVNLYREVEKFEADLIKRAIQMAGGNLVRAARLLNLKYTTLHSKVQRYGLKREA